MDEETVTQIVRAELAALGGHLLTRYGDGERTPTPATAEQLATLGGYLLTTYGVEEGT